jgi:DNA-binding response OmpR family regulator
VSAIARKPITVLVVEDDPELRSLYRSALKAAGYQVVAVDDGLAALRHLENEVPDAVVLDLTLPLVDGGDVYRELAARPSTAHLPIIVVTGRTLSERDAKEFACVLRKPLHVESLIHEIEQCVRHAGSRLL